tara:strand:+ start:5635 stop:6015 length:381 start_codon:yes stop_codon:yes gene_type:complete
VSREYLDARDVLELHAALIGRFGGTHGLRDPGQLDAALHRPQSGYYYDVIEEAAALWESLSQNHPFIDGNKRTALNAMHVFLGLNGIELTASMEALFGFVVPLYDEGRFCFEALEPWLRANTADRE